VLVFYVIYGGSGGHGCFFSIFLFVNMICIKNLTTL
jgi:hypothetical protein